MHRFISARYHVTGRQAKFDGWICVACDKPIDYPPPVVQYGPTFSETISDVEYHIDQLIDAIFERFGIYSACEAFNLLLYKIKTTIQKYL
jgi:hypothetical protein